MLSAATSARSWRVMRVAPGSGRPIQSMAARTSADQPSKLPQAGSRWSGRPAAQ